MSSGFANIIREPFALSTFCEKSGVIYTAEFRILGNEAQTLDLPPLIPLAKRGNIRFSSKASGELEGVRTNSYSQNALA